MSTRRMLLALSNSSPFPILLTVQYYPNLGGYLYTPEGQPETEGYERGPIFDFIKYFNKNYANGHGEETCLLQYGDFTLYISNEDVEFYMVYIDSADFDDGNIGIVGHDASDNEYYGTIFTKYGQTNLNGVLYSYCPGQIYMYKSN